jgi:ubiquinone/menaquinone biosynthesis C-methylase UbiE
MSYIHGTHDEEQLRLSTLNDLVNEQCLELLKPERGSTILDVGSGLGQFTRMMAESCAGTALGIERSPQQLGRALQLAEQMNPSNSVEFRLGDALDLPLTPDERGTFDICHCRFVLEHVPEPQRVVHQMVNALRPRGRIILMDDDHDTLIMWPQISSFMKVWEAYYQSYRSLGSDPLIGRRLPELLHRAGALPVRTSSVFFGGCKGQENFEILVDNMVGLVTGASEAMLENELISSADLSQGLSELSAWRESPFANMVYSLPWAEGMRL